MIAGAQKEMAYLKQYGRPLLPFRRVRQEHVQYRRQDPSEHLTSLQQYLDVAPDLVSQVEPELLRPTLRHPDLQPNNIFVSDKLEITGLIDWQHCVALPLFLQGGIPGSLQNYGDDVSESLEVPGLPENFDDLSEDEQMNQLLVLRKRQLHYHYILETRKLNPAHARTLEDQADILRRKLYRRSGEPWEGCNTIFKRDLIELTQRWREVQSSSGVSAEKACPIKFSQQDAADTIRVAADMEAADQQFQAACELVGVGPEGWVPNEQYEDAKRRAEQLKADTLEEAESEEERTDNLEHWVFDDFDESEYM